MENLKWRLHHFSCRSFTRALNTSFGITDSVFGLKQRTLKVYSLWDRILAWTLAMDHFSVAKLTITKLICSGPGLG